MIIRLLGTGAAEGIPALFSDSAVSAHARKHGGKDVRSRSSALIDGQLKIDLGPDSLHQIHRDLLDARDWSAILFTHSHDDHFAIDELQYCLYPFSSEKFATFSIHGNAMVISMIEERYPDWPFEMHQTTSFKPFQHAEYTITPVRANHVVDEDGQNFMVKSEGSSLLYATDTGVWDEETFDFLRNFQLNALVIECTEGFMPTTFTGHLDLVECVAVVERLRRQGSLTDSSRVLTTHHSHNGGALHSQLETALRPHGIEPGYDGLEICI